MATRVFEGDASAKTASAFPKESMAEVGFDGLFFGRLDYQDLAARTRPPTTTHASACGSLGACDSLLCLGSGSDGRARL